MHRKIISKATSIDQTINDPAFAVMRKMISLIPNYEPSYILDYSVKDNTTHFVRFSTEEPSYGIEIMRCIYNTISGKILYQTIYISQDEEEMSFDISDEE